MSKGRDLSKIIEGDGKIDSSEIASDIVFSGDSITVPGGKTDARPSIPQPGSIRYNTETGLTENYNSAGWQGIDAPPTVIGIAGIINEDTDSVITITGSNFKAGSIVYVEGDGVGGISRPLVTTYVASNELQANTNSANQNFSGGSQFNIKVVNPSGLSGTLAPAGFI